MGPMGVRQRTSTRRIARATRSGSTPFQPPAATMVTQFSRKECPMRLTGMDHIVLNVRDVERSLEFYTEVLGLSPERVESWRAGKNGFPSVRLNETTIIDLARVKDGQAPPSGSPNVNHFCLSTDDD